jgi:hypothetical protein
MDLVIIRLPTTCNCTEAANHMQRPTYVVDCAAGRKMFLPGVRASRRLQLNGDKSEIVWFGTRAILKNISCQDQSLTIGSDTVRPAGAVRHLGVWLHGSRTDIAAARDEDCRRPFLSSLSAASDKSPCGSRCSRSFRTCSRYFPA